MGDLPEGWRRHRIEKDVTFYLIQLFFLGLIAVLVFFPPHSDTVWWVIVRSVLIVWTALLAVVLHGLGLVLKRDLVDYRHGFDRIVKVGSDGLSRHPENLWERFIAGPEQRILDHNAILGRFEELLQGSIRVRGGRVALVGPHFAIYRLGSVEKGMVEMVVYPVGSAEIRVARDAGYLVPALDSLVHEMEGRSQQADPSA